MTDSIKFDATLAKVQTMADNGIRIWFDLPETAVEAQAMLQTAKIHGAYFRVEATPIIQKSIEIPNNNDGKPQY